MSSHYSAYELSGLIEEYFSIESELFRLHSAVAFKALDRVTKESICLWIARTDLPQGSEASHAFLDRMEIFHSKGLSQIHSWGIDSNGVGFVVMPQLDGQAFYSSSLDANEKERRFLQAVRIISKVHDAGLYCGNLAPSSFWNDRDGFLRLVNVIGIETVPYSSMPMDGDLHEYYFFAPELTSATSSKASDVFSLCAIASYLWGNKVPFTSPPVQHSAVAKISDSVPGWCKPILERGLSAAPLARPHSAGELQRFLTESRGAAKDQALTPVLKDKSRLRDRDKNDRQTITTHLPVNRPRSPLKRNGEDSSHTKDGKPLGFGKLGIASFVLLVGMGTLFALNVFDPTNPKALQSQLEDEIIDASKDPIRRKNPEEYYQQLVASDDPVSHAILIKQAQGAAEVTERRLAENALCDRAKRLGLTRSAELVRTWLSLFGHKVPEDYGEILRLIDPGYPLDQRAVGLKKAYKSYGLFIVKLTVALALDTKKVKEYQTILAPLVGDLLHVTDAYNKSTAALILVVPELSDAYGAEALELLGSAPDSELLWLFGFLGRRVDIQAKKIAELIDSRHLLSPPKEVLLTLLMERQDLPAPVVLSLNKALRGDVATEDLNAFGTWYDLEAAQILLAVCADSTNPDVNKNAFDMLATKTFSQDFLSKLFDWSKKYAWSDRDKMAHAIGILSLSDRYSPEQIRSTIKIWNAVSKNPELVKILLTSTSPEVLSATMEEFSALLDTSSLLRLLRHSQKYVRIQAVSGLSKANDVGALKVIIDSYRNESDEEVRQAYLKNIPIIAERENRKQ